MEIEYIVSDTSDMRKIGEFDLVTAIYFIHYLPNLPNLQHLIENIYNNLKPCGRFLTCVLNPDINIKCLPPKITLNSLNKLGTKYWQNIISFHWCVFINCYKC
ncbi:MAG: class I SAM-dependent methyltransferase [bacterium]|nr:class I SAM-dependent methyltransferase [bacterium]